MAKLRLPLNVREGTDTGGRHAARHPGVPPWLHRSLVGWLAGAYERATDDDPNLNERLERRLRQRLPGEGLEAVLELCERDEDTFLHVIDALVGTIALEPGRPSAVAALDAVLKEGASAYEVRCDEEGYYLARRIDRTESSAAYEILGSADLAGSLLANAWRHVYGAKPDPSRALAQAVRAVETAAAPLVLPELPTATLDRIIAALDTEAGSRFTLLLHGKDAERSNHRLRGMCELLWDCADPRAEAREPRPTPAPAPTQLEAAAAVHLAVTLVHWFSHGVVQAAKNEA